PVRAEEQSDKKVLTSTVVFSQVLVHAVPKGWKMGKAVPSPDGKTLSLFMLRDGEGESNWTELILITGFKDVVKLPNASPKGMVGNIVERKKAICPDATVAVSGGDQKIGPHDGHMAMIGCGKLPASSAGLKAGEAEMGAYIVLQGTNDMYVLGHIVRMPPYTRDNAKVDAETYRKLVEPLSPMGLCEINEPIDQCKLKLGGWKKKTS
ncbi:MAG: hypothetical protein KIT73_15480, partial [Burkholderiales bacterium]|nr:hypothetical protein [Burkholderiales bacterium]